MNNDNKQFDYTDNFEIAVESADPSDKEKNKIVVNINIERLVPFRNHPFKLYEGQRRDDLVESVKDHGIINPIIVRPVNGGLYEILSGHNRVEASKIAGLKSIPAVIIETATDDEALFIVTETNLRQRSFTDLSHSEKAFILSAHYDLIKRQGKRNELIQEIDSMQLTGEDVGKIKIKFRADNKTGENYDLSKNTVARYIRINKLSGALKKRTDSEEISIRAAVSLSYLREEEQENLEYVLKQKDLNLKEFKTEKIINMKKAEMLREKSIREENVLSVEDIQDILTKESSKSELNENITNSITEQKHTDFVLRKEILNNYFTLGQGKEEIESIVIEALKLYFEQKNTRIQ